LHRRTRYWGRRITEAGSRKRQEDPVLSTRYYTVKSPLIGKRLDGGAR
jgi:hypothetical protein